MTAPLGFDALADGMVDVIRRIALQASELDDASELTPRIKALKSRAERHRAALASGTSVASAPMRLAPLERALEQAVRLYAQLLHDLSYSLARSAEFELDDARLPLAATVSYAELAGRLAREDAGTAR